MSRSASPQGPAAVPKPATGIEVPFAAEDVTRSWLRALDDAHPEITRTPAPPGYMRGVDAYGSESLLSAVACALGMFRGSHGRWPHPVTLPQTVDHYLVLKFYEPFPLDRLGDKLEVLSGLPPEVAARCYRPARPWISEEPELPGDAEVPPGRYRLKLAIGNAAILPVDWPPPPEARADLAERLRDWFAKRYGLVWGEWWYSFGRQRAYLEEDLAARMEGRAEVKIYVRDGRPVFGYQVLHDFATGVHGQRYFDADLRPMEGLTRGYRPLPAMPLPESIGAMMEVAAAVGQAFRRVRVDFLDIGGPRPCLGELTLCDLNARRRFDPPDFDAVLKRLLFD